MRKYCIVFLGLIALAASIASCTQQSEDVLAAKSGSNTGCDTTNIHYAADVVPILAANCYSCHTNGIVNGGVSLDGYVNTIIPVKSGLLLEAITHAPGVVPMPFDGGQLSVCDIATIQAWIDNGAPDN